MYQITFYVPAKHLDVVKSALFAAGAGKIGDYDQCAWQCLGAGQFRPLAGSQPFIGQQDQTKQVAEYKVEMVCADDHIQAAITALKASHPYEEPAYTVLQCLDI